MRDKPHTIAIEASTSRMTVKRRSFDAAAYLDNEESIAAYISDALASGDSDVLMSAISDVAKARGIARVAADADADADVSVWRESDK